METAVRGADVVVTTTPATEPLFDGAWLSPGAHVNAVGFNGPGARELDDATMSHAVFVDSRAGAASESGNIRRSGAAITAELGEALADPDPSWRQRTTVFDSVGMAIEDVAAAALAWGHSRSRPDEGEERARGRDTHSRTEHQWW